MPPQSTQLSWEQRFWNKVNKTDGCWLWTGSTGRRGYGAFRTPAHKYNQQTHRISYEIHYGPIPDGLWVLHRCDVPGCVRPDHLFLGTPADNMADMVQKGRAYSGDNHWMRRFPERVPRGPRLSTRKLTLDQEEEIRTRYNAGGISIQKLADEYGVSFGSAYYAIHPEKRPRVRR